MSATWPLELSSQVNRKLHSDFVNRLGAFTAKSSEELLASLARWVDADSLSSLKEPKSIEGIVHAAVPQEQLTRLCAYFEFAAARRRPKAAGSQKVRLDVRVESYDARGPRLYVLAPVSCAFFDWDMASVSLLWTAQSASQFKDPTCPRYRHTTPSSRELGHSMFVQACSRVAPGCRPYDLPPGKEPMAEALGMTGYAKFQPGGGPVFMVIAQGRELLELANPMLPLVYMWKDGSGWRTASHFQEGTIPGFTSGLKAEVVTKAIVVPAGALTSGNLTCVALDDQLGTSPYHSAVRMVSDIRAGRVSSVGLLKFLMSRAERINAQIGFIAERNYEQALTRAKEADEARASGITWGHLHGLPVTVKCEIDVEGLTTCVGSDVSAVAERNSPPVQRLLDAGAIIFAKTNVPVNCLDWDTYNPVYGVTSNPWAAARSPGGSSGGSAAAVAVGVSPLELGGDAAGSIRVPASFCGIYGLSPTFDAVHRHVPGTPKTDIVTNGPMARCPQDLELALSVLTNGTEEQRPFKQRRYQQCKIQKSTGLALCQYRIAIWEDDGLCPIGNDVRKAISILKDGLSNAGCYVDAGARPKHVGADSFKAYMRLLGALAVAGAPNEAQRKRAQDNSQLAIEHGLPHLATYWQSTIQSHGEWLEADAFRCTVKRSCDEFFQEYDLLVAPICPCPAFESSRPEGQDAYSAGRTVDVDGVKRPYSQLFFWPHVAMIAGLPGLAVPVNLSSEGLPVGLQVMGPAGGDFAVLRFAQLLASEGVIHDIGHPPSFP